MKRYATLILIMAALLSASCTRPNVAYLTADPELAVIDSLMWPQPDSAFVQLQAFAESHEVDSLNKTHEKDNYFISLPNPPFSNGNLRRYSRGLLNP